MRYSIQANEYRDSVTYLVTLVGRHPSLPIEERQAPFDVPHTRWLKGGREPKTDWMRQRSYDGEKALCNMPDQKRWEEFRPVAEYLGSLMATEWFGRRWPLFRELKVIYWKGLKSAWANPSLVSVGGVISGRIRLGRWAIGAKDARCKLGGEVVALHELAHALCPPEHHHSPLWARTYLELVHFRMGRTAAQVLRAGFREHGVRINPYRVLTEEQRASMRTRLLAAKSKNLLNQVALAGLHGRDLLSSGTEGMVSA